MSRTAATTVSRSSRRAANRSCGGRSTADPLDPETDPVAPTAVATDAAGNVYVTSEKWLAKYSPAGQLLAQRLSARYGAGVFYRITGLAVDAQGTPFVLDRGSSSVCRYRRVRCTGECFAARRRRLVLAVVDFQPLSIARSIGQGSPRQDWSDKEGEADLTPGPFPGREGESRWRAVTKWAWIAAFAAMTWRLGAIVTIRPPLPTCPATSPLSALWSPRCGGGTWIPAGAGMTNEMVDGKLQPPILVGGCRAGGKRHESLTGLPVGEGAVLAVEVIAGDGMAREARGCLAVEDHAQARPLRREQIAVFPGHLHRHHVG